MPCHLTSANRRRPRLQRVAVLSTVDTCRSGCLEPVQQWLQASAQVETGKSECGISHQWGVDRRIRLPMSLHATDLTHPLPQDPSRVLLYTVVDCRRPNFSGRRCPYLEPTTTPHLHRLCKFSAVVWRLTCSAVCLPVTFCSARFVTWVFIGHFHLVHYLLTNRLRVPFTVTEDILGESEMFGAEFGWRRKTEATCFEWLAQSSTVHCSCSTTRSMFHCSGSASTRPTTALMSSAPPCCTTTAPNHWDLSCCLTTLLNTHKPSRFVGCVISGVFKSGGGALSDAPLPWRGATFFGLHCINNATFRSVDSQ